jgi:methanogenic corrinoid protein MtbC1
VSPEVLGLPPVSEHAASGLTRGQSRLVEALLGSDELLARQIIFDLYLARHSLSVIFDDVIAAAFHEIGDRWACHHADVYQERRSCELILRVLFEIRKLQPLPDRSLPAMGGTIEGDLYALPSAMAELVLRQNGFRATSLGTSIPFSSLVRAVEETQPTLFWLSVSHIRDGLDFLSEFATLSRACTTAGTALVVGGRALTESLRHRMAYSAFCDTMQHLESFAKTLSRSLRPAEQAAPPAGKPGRKKG